MILPILLLLNNSILFIVEVIGYHACHSVVMLLDGYYHLCQAILCTLRIVSPLVQYTYTSRQTYGLARVGVLGELVAFVSFVSLSLSVFLESLKHLVDVTLILPQRENNGTGPLKAHGHEHIHSLIDRPLIILGVGIYATVSNVLLAIALLYIVIRRALKLQKRLKERRLSIPEPLPKRLLSKSLLISDTLPLQHSFLQIFSMLIGPVALLACGILLVTLSDNDDILILYSRLVDPIIFCILFVTFCSMIFFPIREVMHLVLQASPCQMNCSEIEKMLCDAIPSISSIHELHIWRLTPQKTLATVHVVFNTKENILDKYQDINFIFQTLHIDHVTIQPEFVLTGDETVTLTCQYPCATDSPTCRPLQCCEPPTNHEQPPVA